jgi:peptidoglycan/LPS O-acetylase OafA/YrhL
MSVETTEPPASGLTSTRTTPTSVRHIPSLDGIRAVSFMVAFLARGGPRHIIVAGDFGVTVFFFLSGFLICYWKGEPPRWRWGK